MGHAENDFLDAHFGAFANDLLEGRDGRFTAVQTEAFRTFPLGIEKVLEPFGGRQVLEQGALCFGLPALALGQLEALAQPGNGLGLGEVHELEAEGAAVDLAQTRGELAHRGTLEAQGAVDEDRVIEIARGEAVALGGELGLFGGRGELQRVEIGGPVAAFPVGVNQSLGGEGVAERTLASRRRRRGRRDHTTARPGLEPRTSRVVEGVEERAPRGRRLGRIAPVRGIGRVDLFGAKARVDGRHSGAPSLASPHALRLGCRSRIHSTSSTSAFRANTGACLPARTPRARVSEGAFGAVQARL